MSVIVPDGYIYVAAMGLALAMQCFMIGFMVSPLRSKLFDKAFFEKHFPGNKEVATAFKGGYPDMGSGQLAAKLSLEDWAKLNSAQRAQYNYMEALPMVLMLLFVSGLTLPKLAFCTGAVCLVGRQVYALGYIKNGPKGRVTGAIIFDIALVIFLILSIYSVYTIGGGLSGFVKFLTS